MSFFITGTDTDVGKTLVSCALLHSFAAQGRRVVGMKPVAAGGSLRSNGAPTGVLLAGAAGCAEGGVNDDVLRLRAAGNVSAGDELVNPYSFAPAIAPHLAAQRAGVVIDTARIVEAYGELAALADVVIVEGAGGFMVPLNDTQTGADLAQQLGLPVIVVVGMRLGCLSHALLTVRAIEACGLQCAGWVANVLDADMPALQENIATLRQRIAAPLLGVVPFMAEPDAKRAAGFLDLGLLGRV
jgi:dethiobiotin synthetase